MDFIEIAEREPKPRKVGLTLVRDPGMGLSEQRMFLESVGEFVDYIKFRNLTPRFFRESLISEKMELYRHYQVKVFTGGIFFEFAWLQGKLEQMYQFIERMGFEAIELSDNIIPISEEDKLFHAKRCADMGLEVIYEWGKKYPTEPLKVNVALREIEALFAKGVSKIILEAGEIDMLIGPKGEKESACLLTELIKRVGMDRIIPEVENDAQQTWLLKTFGPDVNLGPNINPDQVVWLEPMRRGLGRATHYSSMDKWLSKKSASKDS
jgi:phosphosulfolactate synthase